MQAGESNPPQEQASKTAGKPLPTRTPWLAVQAQNTDNLCLSYWSAYQRGYSDFHTFWLLF